MKNKFKLLPEPTGIYNHAIMCGNCGTKGFHEPNAKPPLEYIICHKCNSEFDLCDCPDWDLSCPKDEN